jgi:hypothetical protein
LDQGSTPCSSTKHDLNKNPQRKNFEDFLY